MRCKRAWKTENAKFQIVYCFCCYHTQTFSNLTDCYAKFAKFLKLADDSWDEALKPSRPRGKCSDMVQQETTSTRHEVIVIDYSFLNNRNRLNCFLNNRNRLLSRLNLEIFILHHCAMNRGCGGWVSFFIMVCYGKRSTDMAFLGPMPIYWPFKDRKPIPITDISKIFKSFFLLHYQKYYVFYALHFFQKLQKSGFMS